MRQANWKNTELIEGPPRNTSSGHVRLMFDCFQILIVRKDYKLVCYTFSIW